MNLKANYFYVAMKTLLIYVITGLCECTGFSSVHARVYVCVCVCVRERERERDRERDEE